MTTTHLSIISEYKVIYAHGYVAFFVSNRRYDMQELQLSISSGKGHVNIVSANETKKKREQNT